MGTGKAINLRVRPIQSVDLCYPVDGVIAYQSADLLGSMVYGMDADKYKNFVDNVLFETFENDRGWLYYGAQSISDYVRDSTVSSLRNGRESADLETARAMRWKFHWSTYSVEAIQMHAKLWNDPQEPWASQSNLLDSLEKQTNRLNSLLSQAYEEEGLSGKVVKRQKGYNENKATQYSGKEHVQFEGFTDQITELVDFRVPALENSIRYLRTLIGLRKESLDAWRQSKINSDEGLRRDESAIAQQIKKLQVAYLDTFLIAPFDGSVTGVFRSVGDYVRAGQPVVRVENDNRVYLVGTIKYRDVLRVGDTATVTTTLFGTPGAQPVTIQGNITAVRGHDAVDEQWDVIIECSNLTEDWKKILPLNYNFDFKSTTIEVGA